MAITKHTYIIIAGVFAFEYFPKFIPNLNDMLTALSLLWCFFGLFRYSKTKTNVLNRRKNHSCTYWMLLLIFMSCLSPVFIYGQSIIDTLIAIRTVPLILYLNVFLMMQPSEDDFYKAFKVLGIISVVMTIYATYYNPYAFLDPEKAERRLQLISEGLTHDVFSSVVGQYSIVFLFFLSANCLLKQNFKKKDMFYFLISIVFLFLAQNRSTLLIVIPVTLYIFLKLKFRFKYLLMAVIVLASGAAIYQIADGLLLETQEQLGDTDYARWKALEYYILDWPYNAYTFLFGNGMSCAGSPFLHLLNTAKENGMYESDIGMLGTFFHYGLILTAILYSFMIKGLKKYNPIYLRFFCLWVILVPTIHHFGLFRVSTQLKFAILIYLVMYYQSIYKSNRYKSL